MVHGYEHQKRRINRVMPHTFSLAWSSHCIQDTVDHPCCRHYALFARGNKTVVLTQFHDIKQDEYEKLCGAIIEQLPEILEKYNWFVEKESEI
jgi:hypothetical protein